MAFDEFFHLQGGAWPVEPDEFKEAFVLVTRIYTGVDQFSPAHYKLRVLTEGGEIEHIEVEDTPLNRVLLALRDWYHEEPIEKYISVTWRIFSLSKLIREGILDGWVDYQVSEDTLFVPGPVISVAATLPLTVVEGFDPNEFIMAVIDQQNYQ